MTDVSQISKTGSGFAKASFTALYMDICQHLTPPIAGYMNATFPLLGEPLSFEIVVFVQASIAAAFVKWSPNYFVDSVVNAIMWTRKAWHRILGAFKQPEN